MNDKPTESSPLEASAVRVIRRLLLREVHERRFFAVVFAVVSIELTGWLFSEVLAVPGAILLVLLAAATVHNLSGFVWATDHLARLPDA